MKIDRTRFVIVRGIVVVLSVAMVIGWLSALFTTRYSYDLGPVADTSLRTPYVLDIADRLRDDPVHIDPLLTSTVGEEVVTAEVREAVERNSTPTHLVVLPSPATGGVDPERLVLLARIADEVAVDGIYLLMDQGRNLTHHLRSDTGRNVWLDDAHGPQDPGSLIRVLGQVDDVVDDAEGPVVSPVLYGLLLSFGFSIALWYAVKLLRRSTRRNRSYLEGFRR